MYVECVGWCVFTLDSEGESFEVIAVIKGVILFAIDRQRRQSGTENGTMLEANRMRAEERASY